MESALKIEEAEKQKEALTLAKNGELQSRLDKLEGFISSLLASSGKT
ncbi:MAG: hypothetical protein LBC12_04590 [Nitrososphaerota archaeon]|nr:hypothetical protein [Nitrososphaerota archaeon]